MNADAIVKALKCCNVPSGRACSECPYHEVGAECRTKRNKDAVELILEFTKEIKKWQEAYDCADAACRELSSKCDELTEEIKDIEADYDRVYEQAEADIHGNMADGGTSCHWCADKTKADTVEKMKEIITQNKYIFSVVHYTNGEEPTITYRFTNWDLRTIAKEMLEGKNDV